MASTSNWNRPNVDGREKARRPRTRLVAWASVGVALAVAAFLAAKFMTKDDDAAVVPKRTEVAKPTQIATVSPTSSVKRAEGAMPEAADGQASEQVADEGKKPGVFAPGMIRLPNGFELRFKLPAEGETRQLLAGGEIWEIDSEGNIENVTPAPAPSRRCGPCAPPSPRVIA